MHSFNLEIEAVYKEIAQVTQRQTLGNFPSMILNPIKI